MFILFDKFSRPHVYSLPYVYSGLYSKNISEENVGAWSLNVFHFFMNNPNPIKIKTIAINKAIFD